MGLISSAVDHEEVLVGDDNTSDSLLGMGLWLSEFQIELPQVEEPVVEWPRPEEWLDQEPLLMLGLPAVCRLLGRPAPSPDLLCCSGLRYIVAKKLRWLTDPKYDGD